MVTIWRRPTTQPEWRALLATPDGEQWYPLVLDRARPEDAAAMDELMSRGEVTFVHDTIGAQVRDLIKCRGPSRPWTDDDLTAAVGEQLGNQDLQVYGRWVFYPWSRRLVHVLPPLEYAEVRADRNRNKITAAEQAKLMKLKIGLAGLSVGNAVAVTLALEGLFGELRLADFDTLDLSNMNRLRCTVDQIGLNKAVICARQIYEMNPFANVVLYPDGITRENIGAFFDDGGRLDIAIDECDGMFAKFKIREEAKARRIPVLMETSDRGMLDIERFDLEPNRPLLHGLVGDLSAEVVDKLPPPARVGVILKIIGERSMSPRLAASFLEFGRTLRGFSQLGTDVTLGGATTATAVRRLGLGMPLASGRAYIDLSALLGNVEAPPKPPDIQAANRAAHDRELITALVGHAVMAPSDGNMQPWRFQVRGDVLRVLRDPERSGGASDEFGRFTALVAIGGALENIAIAAAAHGREAHIETTPAPGDPDLAATVRLSPRAGGKAEDPLFEQIPRRLSNRKPTSRTTLNQVHVQVLMEAARQQGVRLQLCQDRRGLAELGRLLGEADRLQLLSAKLHEEYFSRLRWTKEDVLRSRDGLDIDTLELGPAMDLFLQVLSGPVASLLKGVNGGSAFAAPASMVVPASAAVGLLTVEGTTPQAFLRGGRAMQHLWLTATALDIAIHPWNSLIHLFARIERYQGAKLGKDEVRALSELRDQFIRLFNVSLSDTEIMMFRLSYADTPVTRSLRRPVDTVLSFEP